ncbi:MAG: tetratricopeptide repeat protein [Alphaproteobacteria bacterium]|nr:tetratricopeptide repeat protein [Alphaproteobacteria bacterium]
MTGWNPGGGQNALFAAWQAAAQKIESGRAAEAERDLQQAISRHGQNAELLHLLGVARLRLGRPAEAVTTLKTAATLQRGHHGILLNLGNALIEAGQPADALTPLAEAARLAPQLWQPSYLLGFAAERVGDHARAAQAFARVVTRDPSVWDAQLRLVTALRLTGKLAEAAAAAEAALRVKTDDLAMRHDHAMLLALSGNFPSALIEVEEALRRSPEFPEALSTRGNVLGDLGRRDEAMVSYKKATAVAPGLGDVHYNLANLDRIAESYDVACRRYRRALACVPGHADARLNLAAALMGWGRIDESIAAYEACMALRPGWHDAIFNHGMALLLKGDMARGLEGYESRWLVSKFPGARRSLPQPMWDGAPFAGKRLLLHVEQGAGDTLQFARYVPLIAERGGEVLLECPGSLMRLLSTLEGGARLIRAGEPLPPFDMQLPLGSAMRVFGTEVATIPAKIPYLSADPADRARWKRRLGEGGTKIGVTWQGNPDQGSEPYRSIPLRLLQPVLETRGCRFFALQKEFGREQMAELPPGLIEDVGPALTDFAETAAAIAELDLVITTCTSVAHLAGALGKPTWVLLRASPDWRWLMGRTDSPWYPSVELFRQAFPGDWGGVVSSVLERARGLAGVR